MSLTSFRSRCTRGASRKIRRRASVEAIQDAYDPHVLVSVCEDSTAGEIAEMVVRLSPEAAAGYARAILRAVDECLEGH